ncbi:hypothetical protein [Herbiconiux sp.]|jgi:hypothetical protein|uniref:hypothetical protein n=1 Tax=Herbiconiux sp. TaxID=1871186 RepID=UPI0025BE8486|nr:hypothetical protein [Herbiconiux sp.]
MSPHPLFVAAAASYTANCALGASVGLGMIDTRRFRWVHHALYIATSTLAAAAAGSAVLRGRAGDRRAALALAPAAVPLTIIPRISARSRRHVVLALTAAPFFAAGLILSRK